MTMRVSDVVAAMTATGAAFELGVEPVRGNDLRVFTHRPRSLRDLLEETRRFPDRTFLVQDDRRITFGEHLDRVDALAARLQTAHGVEPGDRVVIFAANRWEWVVAFWAIVTAGGVACAYNALWSPEEVAHATALVRPALMIADEPRLDLLGRASTNVQTLAMDQIGAVPASELGERPDPVSIDEDDPAVLIFTSGTTGKPKAVITPHRGICGFLQVSAFGETLGRVLLNGTTVPRTGDDLPLGDDVVLATSPLFHLSVLYGVMLRSVVKGSTTVLLPGRFDPDRVLDTIARERVTSWIALGSAAPRVCAAAQGNEYDTSSLLHIGLGGAPVSPAVQDAIRRTFPQVRRGLTMGYASTESVSVVASIAGEQYLAHPTAAGRAPITVEIEVRDEAGRRVRDGEPGEVHVRSPYIMLGYWDDPDASAAVLRDDGWLAMGDIGRIIDGLLHIDSRARDLILVNAENVTPTEVEYRLEAHPLVVEAAVFAVDDPVTGDAVGAVVVTDPETAIDAAELRGWCEATLARYKVPTRWYARHDPLPRTASGKLVKHEIRRLVGE